MQKDFNFVICRYTQKNVFSVFYFFASIFRLTKPKLVFVQDDNGLQEYNLILKLPRFIILDLFVKKIKSFLVNRKIIKKQEKDDTIKKIQKKCVKYLHKKNVFPHFDCVYSITAQNMAPLGHNFASIFNVPHVTAEHAPFPWPGQVILDEAKRAIEKADAFLAISNDKIRQVLLQNVKVDPIWVGNMCDEEKFSLSNENHEIPSFLIVAANSFYKNYSLFISAMEELKRIATKPFKICIAGYAANKGYSQNIEELENQVANSIIAENTTMIQSVSREDMPKLYNSCDVFVMTSIQEGLPVSALEASMSGLPVFSTRCGGVEDYVDDSMGRIFNIIDYKAIAASCNDYLNGKIAFDNEQIREKAVSLFGKEAFTARMKGIFESVMRK